MTTTAIYIIEEKATTPNIETIEKCCICDASFYFIESYYLLNYEVSDDQDSDYYKNEVEGHVCFTCALESELHLRQLLKNKSHWWAVSSDRARQLVDSLKGFSDDDALVIYRIANLYNYDVIGSFVQSDLFLRMSEGQITYQRLSDSSPELRGFVYLLASPEGYCKIGRTVNLKSRLHSIGLQLPFKVELLHTIKVSDPVKAERFLHKKFSDCRANGEWFLLSVEQINWIKSQTTLEGLY